MQRVLLDTNALLMPFECNFNLDLELQGILGKCEIYVPGPVIGELKRSKSKYAKMALALSAKYPIYKIDVQGDAGIIQAAIELNAYVVTNDFAMQKKLKQAGIKPIFLRSKNHLFIDDF
ncbi:MAG TPA: hypothetical protein VLH13_01410 [Methanomassiliicoccales archaeon]|nr:hypothetical protein [Methanomassiliicoccales archaeon]